MNDHSVFCCIRPPVNARVILRLCLLGIAVLMGTALPASAAQTCGTQCGLGCAPTCYAVSISKTLACGSNGIPGIQTTCASPNGARLSTCEDGCPAGYYVAASRSGVGQCGDRDGYFGYQTDCALIAGRTLRTCDDRCPDGYYPSRVSAPAIDCRGRYELLGSIQTECTQVGGPVLLTCQDRCPKLSNLTYVATAVYSGMEACGSPHPYGKLQTRCELVTGDSLRTCEDGCPAGFYPTSTSTNLQCSTPYFQVETACSKVQGPTLTTCGTACPPNYFLVRTQDSESCGLPYQKQASTCSTINPQGPSIVVQPRSVTIVAGQSTQLSVTAQGQAPLSYQWFVGTSGDQSRPIPGATSSLVQVTPLVTTSYWVLVSNAHGSVASDTATVTVNPACVPASITAQPGSATIEAGQAATLTVTATGTSLVYQWYQGIFPDTSRPVPGGTAAAVTVTPTTTTSYWVRVSNACSNIHSGTVTVTVQPTCEALAITRQPQSVTISTNQVATLSVVASGTSPLYQWYQGTSGDTTHPVTGGTHASIVVVPPATTTYWVRVSNACSRVDSDTVTVTVHVCIPPAIAAQPQPATIDAGQSVLLTVTAGGTSLSYQWYEGARGDTSRPAAAGNGTTLVVAPVETTDYWVRISNDCGTVDSDSVQVVVRPECLPPLVMAQPQSVSIADGESATLTVTVRATSPTFQWYEGAGTSFPVAGGTDATLVVTPHTTTTYWVRITNACGSADSNFATLTVSAICIPPGITVPPQPVSINDGQTATLAVTASGTSPTYQWYQGMSDDLSNPVAGATGSSVSVGPHVDTSYWVRISNACGTFDSATVVVTVTPICIPLGITTQPQSASIRLGESATLAVAASGTTPSFQWYVGGQGDVSTPVTGGIGSSLVVTPTTTTSYWVRVANTCSHADSITAIIFVPDCGMPPAIVGQPQSVTLSAGQTTTLTVSAAGIGLTYQWYEGSAADTSRPVMGATGPALTVSPVTTTSYWVRVSNGCGSQDSDTATVAIESPPCQPIITLQPQSVTIDFGQVATLSVVASGASLSYQWYEGSTGGTSNPVPGGNSSAITVSPGSTTSYWVRISNSCGIVDSDAAVVTVNIVGCGADGTPCGGDGNHTCQGGQCVCSNCASGVCCGAVGNSYCDGQQHFDPNTGYSGACASTLASCDSSNDFDGGNAVYHEGDILACAKMDGVYGWYQRRPSPRCQEVAAVCDFICSAHFGGVGFMCDQNGVWNQSPPLPYCWDGTIPDAFLCQ
jgi:Ig-like domain-containing protein